jgi:Ig-like domain CHU_C associated
MTGTYTITVTLNGCSVSGTSSVTVKPLPTVTPTSPISVCTNSVLTLGVNATAGGTYFWSGPNTYTSSLQNPTVSNAATASMTGTYTITVTLNGCSVSSTSSVTVKPLPTVTPTTPISVCANSVLTLGVNTTAGGTYFWNGPNSFTSSLQNPTVSNAATASMTGTYTITVTLNGCSVSGTSSVTVSPVVNTPTATGVTINQYTSTTLSAVCTGSTAKWYSASSGGIAIGTGSYTTPILSANTTYHVACESGGSPNCVSSTRTPQTVTVIPATTFDSAISGNWNVTSTWICNCIPNGTLPVRIMSTHIVTVPTAYTGQAKGLQFSSTGKLTLQGTGTVNVIN